MRFLASKLVRRIAATLCIVVLLLGGLFAARLLTGPVSLSPLTSYVERNLDETLEGLDVRVGDLVVRWSAEHQDLQVRLVDVELAAEGGSTVAKVPEMEVALSLAGAARGVLAPTRISLIGPSATIIRKNDGSFNVGLGGQEISPEADGESKPILEEVIELFSRIQSPDRPSAYLQTVEITNAKLVFFDQASRTYWQAPDAVLGIRRQNRGVAGYVSAALKFGSSTWRLDVTGFLDPGTRFLDIEGHFADVVLDRLQNVGEGFGVFQGIDLPLSGAFDLVMTSTGDLISARAELASQGGRISPPFFNGDALNVSAATAEVEYDPSTGRVLFDQLKVSAEEGAFTALGTVDLSFSERGALRASYFDWEASAIRLNLPRVFTEPGTVDHIAVRGRWTASSNRLTLESASLRAGDSSFQLSAEIDDIGAESPPVRLTGEFTKFDVDLFPSLWPIQLANGAHDWVVANLSGGHLFDGKLVADFAAGVLAQPKLPDEALRLDFSYSGLTARYINGLPPIRRARGKATLFGDRFELDMSSGRTGDMSVRNGKVIITELHQKPSLGDISVTLSGETSELLRILDLQPLGYPSEFGVEPASVGGRSVLRLRVSLPMIRDLAFKDVNFDGRAQLTGLSIPNVINDVGIDDGEAEIVVTNDYLDAIGVLNLGTLEANVTWREEFDAAELPTDIRISAKVDGVDAKIFGADLSNALMADAHMELSLKGQGQNIKSAMLDADFTQALIDIDEMGWQKPAGQPAKGRIEVRALPKRGWEFSKISFDAEDARLRGKVMLGERGAIEEAQFDDFRLGDDTNAVIQYTDSPAAMNLSVKGEALNISGLIDRILDNSSVSADKQEAPKELDVSLLLDKLTLANGVVLNDVKGQLQDTGRRIQNADFEGTFVDGGVVFASIETLGKYERELRLTASDAGKLLSGVDFTDQLVQGQLDVYAKLTDLERDGIDASATDGDMSLVTNGELSMKNFRVVNAPILAQLLMAGSPQGAQDLLNRDGIGFDRFFVPFQIRDGRISFDRSQALGPAIGITVGGQIDQNKDVLDLSGTIVPSYSINSAIGYVPVVGQLLVSREGEGLFAFTYNIQGPVEEPKIAVNPLSALAPGFLRRIFQIGQDETVVPKLKPGAP